MKSKNSTQPPPFTITPAILKLVAEISELVGRMSLYEEELKSVRLRRSNRIRTIHGSLAIEGNTLSREQIRAVLNGKRIIAPPRELREVHNAIKAYDLIETWDPYSRKDLLACHRILLYALLDNPGSFRTASVGIMGKRKEMHLAPPADRVPFLIKNLFAWLEKSSHHPLIASSVFHYEFEFIHPFQDGNGRIGRLWQTLILSKWHAFFTGIPIESLVHEHQTEYYNALNRSTAQGESSAFIEFMLAMIRETMNAVVTPEVSPHVTPEVINMLRVCRGEMSRTEIQRTLGLKDEKHFREHYLRPALSKELIEWTIPDKPRSRFQKYRLTPKGAALISAPKRG